MRNGIRRSRNRIGRKINEVLGNKDEKRLTKRGKADMMKFISRKVPNGERISFDDLEETAKEVLGEIIQEEKHEFAAWLKENKTHPEEVAKEIEEAQKKMKLAKKGDMEGAKVGAEVEEENVEEGLGGALVDDRDQCEASARDPDFIRYLLV